jgi:hypothetical protein
MKLHAVCTVTIDLSFVPVMKFVPEASCVVESCVGSETHILSFSEGPRVLLNSIFFNAHLHTSSLLEKCLRKGCVGAQPIRPYYNVYY